MRRLSNRRGDAAVVPVSLALLAYVLAIVQSPGLDTSDTKINLHLDPGTFLGQVASVWSPTQGLGHVQGSQYSGYLWPMGPFFALGHLIGLSDWLTERLWLGTLLALAAWGTARLIAVLYPGPRTVAQVLAGVLYIANPYVIVIASRTTVTLLGYAALPWLMLVTHRGLRERGRWWPAAAFGLIITSTAGGVNAAVTAFVLVGPLLLAIYDATSSPDVTGADLVRFGWRAAVATLAASVWWAVPILVQVSYGLNFLPYTEHLGSIGSPTSLSETLRLMGYWPTYLGVGYGTPLTPWFSSAGTLLFNRQVLVSSLLVPGYALAGFFWTRRWRYGPLFLLMGLVGLLLMSAGWPSGTPARVAAVFVYDHVQSTQFLRTTYKAGPLLALAVAVLAGVAAQMGWDRLRAPSRLLYGAVATAVVVFAALPMFEGKALQLTWRSIPSAWTDAARYLDSSLPSNSRAVVLPGQDFAYYKWGATIDPILPALTTRPVAVRNDPPYDDLHAVDFLWTVDDLLQQQALLPRQLGPLLDVMSARAVVTATDDADLESGALAPAAAADELAQQPGFGSPTRSFGPFRSFSPSRQTAAKTITLPEVRIYDAPARGLVRVEPQGPATVVDGSAAGLADLAALHELPSRAPIFYAGDETVAAIRRQAAAGGNIYITDSNRRRVFVASQVLWSDGWTVPAGDAVPQGSAVLDPFASRGASAQTVAVFSGARDILAPFSGDIAQYPENRPYAAFDGDPRTWWGENSSQRYLEVELGRPRAIPYISILPHQTFPYARLGGVIVNGRRMDVHPGWNRLRVQLPPTSTVKITMGRILAAPGRPATGAGFAEIKIPGVSIHEFLRPPVLAERALRGADLSHASLNYVFQRTTDPAPLQRVPNDANQDPEQGLARTLEPPAARDWTISGLANVSAFSSDSALDALAGTNTRGAVYTSSKRLDGLPAYRASSAFDSSPDTAWVAPFGPPKSAWIGWTTPAAHTLRRLLLQKSSLPVRFPTVVSIIADGASTPPLPVSSSGLVTLPHPLRSRSFRLIVIRAAGSSRFAVGIAGLVGTGAPTVSNPPTSSQIRGRCGDLSARIDALTVPLRASGTVAALDAGEPLALRGCGGPFPLAQAQAQFTIAPGVLLPLIVQLHSPAPDPLFSGAPLSGSVLDSGHMGNTGFTGIRVRVNAPSWLVLGESYSPGWQASCNGRSLGAPRVIDAFANGWRVDPGCRTVSIWFAPQSDVVAGYVVGALACLVLLIVLVAGLIRGRARDAISAPERVPAAPALSLRVGHPARHRFTALLGFSLVGGAVGVLLFGVTAGIVMALAFAVIVSCRVSSDVVIAAAGVLLVIALPVYYVLATPPDRKGYDAGYAAHHQAGHWIAAAAVALLALALAFELISKAARRPRGGPSARPPAPTQPPERA